MAITKEGQLYIQHEVILDGRRFREHKDGEEVKFVVKPDGTVDMTITINNTVRTQKTYSSSFSGETEQSA